MSGGRRAWAWRILVAILAAGLLASGGAAAAAERGAGPVHREARPVMGTLAEVALWAPSPAVARVAADSVFACWTRLDSLLSSWNGASAIGRLNRAELGDWTDVGPEAARLLARAREVAAATEGAFDPTVLPLVRAWGFRGGRSAAPSAAEAAAARDRVDFRFLAVDTTAGTARLERPGMGVDLGGIAKGHALARAAAAARRAGAVGGILDLGGNLYLFGAGPTRQVGVVDPEDPAQLACTVPVRRGAVATSGQYERTAGDGERTWGHILDPRSGLPAPPGVSVTVIAADAVVADALATAAVVLGETAGLALLAAWSGVEGVVVGPAGVRATPGLTATGGAGPVSAGAGRSPGVPAPRR